MRLSTHMGRLLAAMIVAVLASACAEDPDVMSNVPRVTSLAAREITFHSAKIIGYLDNWSDTECLLKVDGDTHFELPGVPDDKGTVEWKLKGLSPSTQYSLAIELSADGRTVLSEVVTFETEEKIILPEGAVAFGDPAFEKYCVDKFDTDEDGFISEQEAKQATGLHVNGMGITSLEGIEHFTNLTTLHCSDNYISAMPQIRELPLLTLIDCRNNLLENLDVSGNSRQMEAIYCTPQREGELRALTIQMGQTIHGITDTRSSSFIHPATKIIEVFRIKDSIFEQYCCDFFDSNGDGLFTTDEAEEVKGVFIDDMGISSINEINYFTNLEILSANGNLLNGQLDLSSNDKLTTLLVNGNQVSSIILSPKAELERLDIGGCPISSDELAVELQGLTKLKSLSCDNCGFETLDLSLLPYLSNLDCVGNHLEVLDLRRNASEFQHLSCTPQEGGEVKAIYIRNGQTVKGVTDRRSSDSVSPETSVITAILFESPAFESYCLEISDSDGDGFLAAEEAECIDYIDIRQQNVGSIKEVKYFPNLSYLVCAECGLTGSVDLSQNSKLEIVGLYDNDLIELVIGNHPKLSTLTVQNNRIPSLDLSGVPGLITLSLNYCPVGDSLNDELKKTPLIQDLRCTRCNLTSLDLSTLPYLKFLYCTNNRLTSLDLSHNADRMDVYCRQYYTKEIETIYIRAGQTVLGLTENFDDSCFSPTTKVVVK